MAPRHLSPAELSPGAPDSCSCQLDSTTWNLNQRGQSQIPSLPPRPPAPQPSPSWWDNPSVVLATDRGIVPAFCLSLSHRLCSEREAYQLCLRSAQSGTVSAPHLEPRPCCALGRLASPHPPHTMHCSHQDTLQSHHALLRILLCAHVSESTQWAKPPSLLAHSSCSFCDFTSAPQPLTVALFRRVDSHLRAFVQSFPQSGRLFSQASV